MLFFIIGSITFILFFSFVLKLDSSPLVLLYSRPGKWYPLKFHLMRFIIGHRQKSAKKKDAKKDDLMKSQFGSGGMRNAIDLERKHEFTEKEGRPADAVFFNASNKDGFYLSLGTAQRKNNIMNLFFVLRIPKMGTFIVPEMMTNTNVESVESTKEWKTISGFTVRCDEPMKKWTITYKGNLVKNSGGSRIFEEIGPESEAALEGVKLFTSSFELTWTNFGDYFDFDQEVSPISIAHSLAIEPWSKELFKKLKEFHQSHYEQFGILKGSFEIGEEKTGKVELVSMRDHTITSHRNWSEIRRYIMMIYHLDDSTCIHTSLISMPGVVFSHLEFGYLIKSDKKKHPVDRIRLHLADVGERKDIFPSSFNYSFEAGGEVYDVQVAILESVSFKMGLDQACYVEEKMAQFTVNGVKGRGFVEAEYRIQPY